MYIMQAIYEVTCQQDTHCLRNGTYPEVSCKRNTLCYLYSTYST